MVQQNEELEHTEMVAYRRYEADVEFDRARRQATLRFVRFALARLFRTQPGNGAAQVERSGAMLRLPLATIVGMAEGSGALIRRIPRLDRSLRTAWQHAFLDDTWEAAPTLCVVEGPDGWYLVGGIRALLRMEILKAKGFREILLTVGRPAEGAAPRPAEHDARSCADCPTLSCIAC